MSSHAGRSATVERLREQARRHAQLGRPAEAERAYLELLERAPDDFEALYRLGAMELRRGRFDRAVELLSKAVAVNASVAATHGTLGNALVALDRVAEGLSCFETALSLDPGLAAAHHNRGTALRQLGRLPEALTGFDTALRIQPDYADAHRNRGLLLVELGRLPEALAGLERAVALAPNNAATQDALGCVLRVLKRHGDALACFDRAIALQRDFADAQLHRGMVLHEAGRPADAVLSYDAALALRPSDARAYTSRGVSLLELGRAAEALDSQDRAVAHAPEDAEAHSNRGMALHRLERYPEALESCDRALALNPELAQAHNNRARALERLHRFDEALASYDRALAAAPADPRISFNKSHCCLLLGYFEEGWQRYEARTAILPLFRAHPVAGPLWTGAEPLEGKTLFIHSEQGLGDTIQFCRYAALAADRATHVIMSVQPPIRRLLAQLDPRIEMIDAPGLPRAFDFQCPLLSLPLAFGTTLQSVPSTLRYLPADAERVERWRRRLGAGFKIGIAWQGGTTEIDRGRSLPLAMFEPLARLVGVRLISLQKGFGTEQIACLSPGLSVETLGDDFDGGPDGFLDTAAVMEAVDLTVTSDTSIAHLAGALGRPVWVALQHLPDWRWLTRRADSPWYPSMRLFRQPSPGAWRPVFETIAAAVPDAFPSFSIAPRH